jgi:hypothetical protein
MFARINLADFCLKCCIAEQNSKIKGKNRGAQLHGAIYQDCEMRRQPAI